MKFNLKNFPNWNMPIPDYEEAKRLIEAHWEWFEGFEAELREMLKFDRASPINWEDLIKEILGE